MPEQVMIGRVPDEQIETMYAYLTRIDVEIELDQRHMHTLSKVLAGYESAWDEVGRLREQLAAGAEAAQLAIEQLEQTSEILRTLQQNNPIMAQARRYIAGLQGPEASES